MPEKVIVPVPAAGAAGVIVTPAGRLPSVVIVALA